LLDLEVIEVNIFRGYSPEENRVRVFGGQVAGQSLVAASRTVDEKSRFVHSLHAYFLRPGDPTAPILYEVDRLRDGRSFTTRRVVAIQHGEVIFNLQASFHEPETGLEWQIASPTNMANPETLPDFKTRMAPFKEKMGDWYHQPRPIDLRYVNGSPFERQGVESSGQQVWLRADGTLPDDPVLHAWNEGGVQMASLDHAMWFHRPFRADDWLLYDQVALSTSNSRGLAGGSIYTQDGQLAVTVVQEGLIRVKPNG
jgi:acyl-CoA thioesterase-2